MEACYEYLGCCQTGCIMYGRKHNRRCWEVEGTLCNHQGIQIVRAEFSKKVDACAHSSCIYYKAAKERGLL